MIPSSAIEDYLGEPKQDHRALKKYSPSKAEALLAALRPPPTTYEGLRLHQKICVYLGIKFPRFSFWLDMGTGKTLVTLELLTYWWELGKMRRAVVLITSDKALPTWINQIKRFNIPVPYLAPAGNSFEKMKAMEDFKSGIILLPYPSAVAMCSRRGPKGKRKNALILDRALIKQFATDVDILVMDESTRAGHSSSLTHKLCNALSRKAWACYALAGRPFGRDPSLLWVQQYLVDRGETLGPTLGLFRSAFFDEKQNYWDRSGYSKEYKFKQKMMPTLSRMLQHRSISYTADECIDLPPRVSMVETIDLPQEARVYYQRVVNDVIAAQGNLREMKNAFLRMRQLSSGFMGFVDDETGERAEFQFEENPKLDKLLDLIYDMPDDRQAVVFYEYTWSGRLIANSLTAAGIRNIWLWSGTKSAEKDLRNFGLGKARVAVVNNRVGAYSLDGLQVANYCFFYESPVSVIDREQAERRLLRQGQQHKVFQYDLVVRGTLDQRVLDFHREGQKLFDALIKDPKKLLESPLRARAA